MGGALFLDQRDVQFHHQRKEGITTVMEIGGYASLIPKLNVITRTTCQQSVKNLADRVATKLARIDGDLHVMGKARFYAPLLEEVTGFIYLGDGATVNAPKIEHLLSNDDTSKIQKQAEADWLNTLAG